MATAKERILRSADTLFGEAGFDGTTTREIAEASGVNKALIHYHFASKDALFQAVLDRYYDKLDQVLRVVLEEEGPLPDRFVRLIDAYTDFLRDNRNYSRMIQREVSGGRHVGDILARMVPPFQAGVALMERAFPSTREGELSASQLLVSFYGMTVGYFAYGPVVEHLLGVDPFSEEGLALRKRHLRRMLDIVLAEVSQHR
ncbi:MAG: TetR/AcrR family transcriptional regulator [Deltaproteobacteria bacterium]|nr:TetR/AcrR family transcriptional regulator [Deltaproteobacteria bacterium]